MGQFATPTELAGDVVSAAVELLGRRKKIRFLDPAIGTGSFYSALCNTVNRSRVARAIGYEIDPHYGEPSKLLWKSSRLEICLEDFTQAPVPTADGERFNLLVCNPPYVRHHHIAADSKKFMQVRSQEASGVKIAGLAGLYCYFVALAHPWMEKGGIAAWLVPSEFMDVNYGQFLKRYFLTKVELLRIHRFDPNDVQFGDALVSSAVVLFRNSDPDDNHKVSFTYGGTLKNPAFSKEVASSALNLEAKWTRFPKHDVRPASSVLRLGDLFRIKRGLATGDNRFFIMTPDQIVERGLPKKFLRPILPSPRYLETDHVLGGRDGTPMIECRQFLLDCRLPEAEVKKRYPDLWSYYEASGSIVKQRYLCRTRRPWYAQEERPAAPIICTYLGRSDKKNGRPFRFIRNESDATAANVYLMLYPKPVLERIIEQDPKVLTYIWEQLNKLEPEHLLGEGRVYGGGLHKLEPRELANVPIETLGAMLPIDLDSEQVQQDLFETTPLA